MKKTGDRDWLDIVSDKFDHPAIVLWRAVELKHIADALCKYDLEEPVLDLGCAEGKIADILFAGKKLIGLDNCWELLKQNQKDNVYKALILSDACLMPYKDAVFGSVFSNCVIEHIPDIDMVLDEIFRVLKERGIFLFSIPSHKFADFLFFNVIFENLKLRRLARWYRKKRNKLLHHFHCYNHNQWQDILKKKRFELLDYRYYMSEKATFLWDFLAASVLILRFAWPLSLLLPKANKWFIKYLKTYYNNTSLIGGGLLLVARKK